MTKNTVTTEVISQIIELNTLLSTASLHIEDAAQVVKNLIKKGVKRNTIVEHSGYVTLRDIQSLLDIAEGKLSPKLWLIACPGSPVLRKAPVETQEKIVRDGAVIYNQYKDTIETIPVAKLTKVLATQLIDNKGNLRSIVQQRRFLSSWTPPAKKPLYQVVDNNTVRFNRACTLTKPELRKLLRA